MPLATSAQCLVAADDGVGVSEGHRVAHGAVDAEPEQFAHATDVAAGGAMCRLLGPTPVRTLRAVDARALCISLRAHPQEIWARRQADRLGYVDWDTETLWSDTGVDPIIVET